MPFISEITINNGNNNATSVKLKDKNANAYLECSTGRNTADKVVNFAGFELFTGVKVAVCFTDTGSNNPVSGNITLNINSTGAKTVKDNSDTILTYSNGSDFANGKCYIFVYDGTYWVMIGKSGSGGGGAADLTGEDTNDVMLISANEL